MLSRAPFYRRLRRTILGHRRILAAALTAVAVGSALQVVRPPTSDSTARPTRPSSLGMRLAAAHPGLVPVPVRLPDAGMADLLEPGDHVTVLATGSEAGAATERVAADVLVLQIPRATDAGMGAGTGVTSGEAGRLVIIGVDPSAVQPVTNAAVRSVLTFSWDR